MSDKVGESFDGVVSAVAEFGFFVELKPVFVEGLVRADDLKGAFALDPVRHALVDQGSGRAFRVGDEVRVRVSNASPARRQITLELVSGGAAAGELEEAEEAGQPARVEAAQRPAGKARRSRPRAAEGQRPERRQGKRGAPAAGTKGPRPAKPGKRSKAQPPSKSRQPRSKGAAGRGKRRR
jgi:ribonuclease R